MFLPWTLGLVASSEAYLPLHTPEVCFYEIDFLLQLAIFYCNLGLGIE